MSLLLRISTYRGTEIILARELETSTTLCFTPTLRVVAPPVDLVSVVTNSKEDDDSSEGYSCRERGGEDIVVLRPQWKISGAQISHADISRQKCGPYVGNVVL